MAKKSPQDTINELKDLVIAYFKQETVEPLKALGRYVGFGLLGGLLLGTGVFFAAMGGLRALQTETGDAFDGNWTFAPYAIMVVVLAGGAALTWMSRGAGDDEGASDERGARR